VQEWDNRFTLAYVSIWPELFIPLAMVCLDPGTSSVLNCFRPDFPCSDRGFVNRDAILR
jgi:hypothetical protein